MTVKEWGKEMTVKDWMVALLTLVFMVLYVGAMIGWLQPPSNDKLVVQIAPIISVIIGYYFGRIPGEKSEEKLDQARTERDQAVTQNAKSEGKITAAKAALSAAAPSAPPGQLAANLSGGGVNPQAVQNAAAAALKVLETP
jgi:hypothetical protein